MIQCRRKQFVKSHKYAKQCANNKILVGGHFLQFRVFCFNYSKLKYNFIKISKCNRTACKKSSI